MTQEEIERVAKRLTEAQRDWIDRLEGFPLPFKKSSHFDIPAGLAIFLPSDLRGVVRVSLSETGLAVRAHLAKDADNAPRA